MTTATTTLTDFLLARIAEEREGLCDEPCHEDDASMRFALAECEAKRRIVERTSAGFGINAAFEPSPIVEWILRQLALPYADHADYNPEWRP